MSVVLATVVILTLIVAGYCAWLLRERERAKPIALLMTLVVVAIPTAPTLMAGGTWWVVLLALACFTGPIATVAVAYAWPFLRDQSRPVFMDWWLRRALALMASFFLLLVSWFTAFGLWQCDTECSESWIANDGLWLLWNGPLALFVAIILEWAASGVRQFRGVKPRWDDR